MTEGDAGAHAVGDVGDLSAEERALITEMLGAPTTKGALRRGFKVMPRILPYLKPYRKFAVISVTLTVLLAVLALAQPWPLAFTVDSIIGHKEPPSWVTNIFGSSVGAKILLAVGATLFLTAVSGLMTVWNEYLSTTIDQRMVLDFRSDMFEHAQKLSLAFHDTESKGILMYRINNQASAMGSIVVALPALAQNLLTVVGMAYISVRINPLLALLALGTTPFVVYSTTYYTERIEPRLYRVRGLGAINLAIVYEAMSMIRVVLAFGTQRREFKRFRQQGETFVDETVGLTVRQTAFKLGVQLITAAGTASVIGVGAYQAVNHQITAGELLVILSYINQIYQPLEELTNTITNFQQQFISLLMSFDLMDIKPDITDKEGALPLERARGDLEFDHVDFGYDGRDGVLKDISLHIPAGQAVAVVGPTGAGKSTLASLPPRFYDPAGGTLRIDGHDLRDLKTADVRKQFSIVLQEPLLFSGTIANNIRYGKTDASMEEVIEAAKAANAHDFISEMPQGYSTLLGERGTRISGGERQRIAVARAFLRDAPILILDEPTSSIDSRTESVILDALDRLMEGRTTILIAHRLSTIRSVDEIVVMDHGQIVQRGTHEELAAEAGLYRQLWEAQTRAGDGLPPPTAPALPPPKPARPAIAPVARLDALRLKHAAAAHAERDGAASEPEAARGARVALPRPKIVLLGMLTKIPVGGVAWLVGHYAAGFERLGYDVYYVEAHARTPSMFMTHEDDDGAGKAAAYISKIAKRFGLENRWAFQALHENGRCYGMSASELDQLYKDAALIVNMHGGTLPLPEHAATDRLVFLGTDPVEVELEVERGDERALEFLDQHVAYFTWGLNFGNQDCKLPWARPYPFVPSPPPVVLDFWENSAEPSGPFTTIGNWRQEYRDVEFGGQVFRWSKHQQFMKILDLPMRTRARIELALSSYEGTDRLLLAEHGWRVRPGLELSRDPDSYRDYIVQSAGEVTAAKEQNVHFRTGWFSERSATYLAAGRPVIMQDTGFGSALPTGEGLFAFSNLQEAVEAVKEVQADPARHRRAASELAREYLSHEVVLGDMLDHVGLRAQKQARPASFPGRADLPHDLPLELSGESAWRVALRPVPAVRASAQRPAASVIMPVDNDLPRTRMALEAVLSNSADFPYELVVVDCGSADPVRQYLEVVAARNRHVRLVRSDVKLGFAEACDAGAHAGTGDFLVVLAAHTVVTPGWLAPLLECLGDPTVGLAGPATNSAGGEDQIPTSYATYGELVDFARRRREELAGAPPRDVTASELFCVALNRDVYEAIGPFAGRADGETSEHDYAGRVRNAGRRVVCAYDVFVHRFGEGSLAHLDGDSERSLTLVESEEETA
ncbi:MAG TPA: ATP-binding cassette domain-containing protein [Thermoleophilaceae bacterium]